MRLKLILASATLALAYQFAWGQTEVIADGVAAVVGRNMIKYSDVERAYAQARVRTGATADRCDILENLILNNLLIYKGEVDSVEVTDDELKQYVDEYLQGDLRQYGTKEALREATGFTYDELREQYARMIKNYLISRRVEYKITDEVRITPQEVSEFFNSLPADSLPTMPEKYELSEIVIQPQISEAERDRVRTELAALRERVINGERFSMLATLYSQDPESAKRGGELGFFSRGQMVGEFESAAFALKPGEVSPIVETQFGFHIIQLVERRGNTINCRHILIQPKVSSADLLRARITLDSLATAIRDGKVSFEDAARQYSTAASAKQGGKATNEQDRTNRFDKAAIDEYYYNVGISGMDEGQVSNATAMRDADNKEAYRIVRLDKRYPEHKANLTDDYDNIYNAALAAAKQKKVREWAVRQAANTYIFISERYNDCPFNNLELKR